LFFVQTFWGGRTRLGCSWGVRAGAGTKKRDYQVHFYPMGRPRWAQLLSIPWPPRAKKGPPGLGPTPSMRGFLGAQTFGELSFRFLKWDPPTGGPSNSVSTERVPSTHGTFSGRRNRAEAVLRAEKTSHARVGHTEPPVFSRVRAFNVGHREGAPGYSKKKK